MEAEALAGSIDYLDAPPVQQAQGKLGGIHVRPRASPRFPSYVAFFPVGSAMVGSSYRIRGGITRDSRHQHSVRPAYQLGR